MSFRWFTVFLDLPAGSFDAALGSRTVHSFPFWTVLADPAGQRYCLIDRDPDIAQHSGPAEA